MPHLFADRVLAERIEGSVARDLALYAEQCMRLDPSLKAATLEFAGGVALYIAPDSPINSIFGAGLAGPARTEELAAAERFYAERGTRAAISLCPLADEEFVAQLGVRGWMLTDFENVLVRELDGVEGLPAPSPDVEVRIARSAEERARWAVISSSAFRAPEPPSPEIVRLGEVMASRESVTLLTGVVDGREAGTGALWIDDGMAWLLSDGTLPEYRRRGVQSALLAERTRLAVEAGCEFAVTEARPGTTSQRNMERLGYRVVYTRVELIGPAEPYDREGATVTTPGTAKPTVAFIGTGVMGAPMAGHLMDAGYPLVVFNRTKSRADGLVARGAKWAASPGEAAASADVVVTIVGYPADVEAVYLNPGGIVERARDGAVLVDMTTSSPALAERISAAAQARGISALDAPVSGGDIGAKNATLTIMVGGDERAFGCVEPLLRAMGSNVVLQGGPGAGQHTKMANQVAIAGSMLATVESLAYAQAAGLDPRRVLESIGAGSAASWSLANLAPRILDGNFGPGFYVKHFVKDLRIALASAEESGIDLPGCTLAKRLYEHLEASGGEDLGTQALWLLYADAAVREAAGVDAAATTVRATERGAR